MTNSIGYTSYILGYANDMSLALLRAEELRLLKGKLRDGSVHWGEITQWNRYLAEFNSEKEIDIHIEELMSEALTFAKGVGYITVKCNDHYADDYKLMHFKYELARI